MEDTQWRTHRLELDDQTLREWDAQVLAADAEGIVLDRSAFYPACGQPPEVKEVRIIDIVGRDQQADGGTHVASTRLGELLGRPGQPAASAAKSRSRPQRRRRCDCSGLRPGPRIT